MQTTRKEHTGIWSNIRWDIVEKAHKRIDNPKAHEGISNLLITLKSKGNDFDVKVKELKEELTDKDFVDFYNAIEHIKVTALRGLPTIPQGQVETIIRHFTETLDKYKKQYCKSVPQPPVKTQPTQTEIALRIQQKLLNKADVKEHFHAALSSISKHARDIKLVPKRIAMLYVSEIGYMEWVPTFLEQLRRDIFEAGCTLTELYGDQVGSNNRERINQRDFLLNYDEIILFCTEALNTERNRISAEGLLGIMSQFQQRNKKIYRIGLSGEAHFNKTENNWFDWNLPDGNYFQHFKDLFALFYGAKKDAFNSIWDKFLNDIGDNKNLITQPLDEKAIQSLLAIENQQRIDDINARDRAARALLNPSPPESKSPSTVHSPSFVTNLTRTSSAYSAVAGVDPSDEKKAFQHPRIVNQTIQLTRSEPNLYLEQTRLMEDPKIFGHFKEMLELIKVIAAEDYEPAYHIAMVGSEIQEESLQWIYPFLKNLKKQLILAGIETVDIMQREECDNNYYAFMAEISSCHTVLLFGTEGLLNAQMSQRQSNIHTQLIHIRSKREIDAYLKRDRFFPIVLSGTLESSLPAEYAYSKCIFWTGKESYLTYFKTILAKLLNWDESEKRYESIWNSFLSAIELHYRQKLPVVPTPAKQKEVKEHTIVDSIPLSVSLPVLPPAHEQPSLPISSVVIESQKAAPSSYDQAMASSVSSLGVFSGSVRQNGPPGGPAIEVEAERYAQ